MNTEEKHFMKSLRKALISEDGINLLPELRKARFEGIEDEAIFHDIQADTWQGKRELQNFYFEEAKDGTLEVGLGEPDWVVFSRRFPNKVEITDEFVESVFLDLIIIRLSDCSNCCNALDFITVNKYGIAAKGDIGMIYHS